LGLVGALSRGFGDGGEAKSTRFRIEYEGKMLGCAIEAYVTRSPQDGSPAASTLLGSIETKVKVLMVLSDDETELKLMENPQGSSRISIR